MRINEVQPNQHYHVNDDRLGDTCVLKGAELLAELADLYATDWADSDVVAKCGGDPLQDDTDYQIVALHWTAMGEFLQDSDGVAPDDDDLRNLMCEFRDAGSIQGYWFCDFSHGTRDGDYEDLGFDSMYARWRPLSECGPDPDIVDFSGLTKTVEVDATEGVRQ